MNTNSISESGGGNSVVTKGDTPRLISNQFSFTEGPAVDRNGNVFFTDQPNDKIWKYGTDGTLTVFMDKTGRSNGMYFDKDGNLVTCADQQNEIWSISPEKKVTVLFTDLNGKKINGPNDLWIHPAGGIYFTDPYYQRDWWTRKKADIEGEKVYYLPKGKREAIAVADNLQKPNGIIGTPDGKFLYVADIKGNKTFKYRIAEDGTLQDPQLFAEQGSDGMTIDNSGNLYLTGNGVTVYNSAGTKIQQIPVPEKWTANVCFAGKNRNQLFITASKSVYILDMLVKGVK
ncbi:MAG TPA: SMP-30/gluconolactonase/LRE family protein [Segetibacter sp.]